MDRCFDGVGEVMVSTWYVGAISYDLMCFVTCFNRWYSVGDTTIFLLQWPPTMSQICTLFEEVE